MTGEGVKFKIDPNGGRPAGGGGGEQVVSIRPHRIRIRPADGPLEGSDGLNVFQGEVVRGFYFGSTVDYLIQVGGLAEPLRVIGDPEEFYPVGEKVRVVVEPKAVVLLQTSDG